MSRFPANGILVGHYTVAVGSGGAIHIPKNWRDYFGDDKPVKVLLLQAPGPSVWIFAGRYAKALRDIEVRTPPDEETLKFLAEFGKPCERVLTSKYDLRLSADLRRSLGIRKQAILNGCYEHAEIMSPETWKKIDIAPDPLLDQATRDLGFF
jgi:DNA-binding transcriptional regulator/RsmH inhibitor MraZ